MAETLGGILAGQPSGISPAWRHGMSLGTMVIDIGHEEDAEDKRGAGI